MEKQITAAIIGAVGGILAALVGQIPVKDALSSLVRHRSNIPDIMKTKWKAEWKYADGSSSLSDKVTFSAWTKNNQFKGFGEIEYPNKEYKYSIVGEVSPRGVVVLNYKAERYPTEANIGTACLQLSGNAEDLVGTWIGLEGAKQSDGTEIFKLRSGNVTMHKIKELSP